MPGVPGQPATVWRRLITGGVLVGLARRRAMARLAIAATVGLLLAGTGAARSTAHADGRAGGATSTPGGATSTPGGATSTPGGAASTPAGADASTGVAPCTSLDLRVRGAREGAGFGTARGQIEVTNVGSTPCRLDSFPEVSIMRSDGARLPVTSTLAPGAALHPVTLAPLGGQGDVLVSWINWCGPDPGPLLVGLTLPRTTRTVVGPFDDPPDRAYVPICRAADQHSEIAILVAW